MLRQADVDEHVPPIVERILDRGCLVSSLSSIAMNYCAGYIRHQENQQLGIPLETVRGFAPRLHELAGFSIYNGLIGHIDGRTPADVLLGDSARKVVWDR
jgi:hypothetical protein